MAEPSTNHEAGSVRRTSTGRVQDVHPAWLRLIHYCAELDHGEIEKLKIQDGFVAAEATTKKIKFSP